MSKLTRTKAIITGAGISVILMGCSSSGHSDDAVNALSIKTSADTVTEIQQAITTIQATKCRPKLRQIPSKQTHIC